MTADNPSEAFAAEPAGVNAGAVPTPVGSPPTWSRRETLTLTLVLVAAYHGIQRWLFWEILPTGQLYHQWGPAWYSAAWDAVSWIAPLILCLGAPRRSGLCLGDWRRWRGVLVVVLLPIVATAIFCPFTSNPFYRDRVGTWLISPPAQELMFSGYLYGLISTAFPGSVSRRLPVPSALLVTAAFFALWHTPGFYFIPARFVWFQLLYTFLGGMCFMLARRWTGSILPGTVSHMGANFCAWAGL